MGVDIVHLLRLDSAVCQRAMLHGLGAAAAVGRGARSCDRRRRWRRSPRSRRKLGAPASGVVQLLQQEDAGALAQDKAAALQRQRDGGPLGIGTLAQGLHGGEAADGQGVTADSAPPQSITSA